MENSPISIRRALADDSEALEQVRACSSPIAGETSLEHRLKSAETFTYLAEDEMPFGFVTVGRCELSVAEGQVFEWYLMPVRQGRALGRRLFVHGLSVLKRQRFETAMIWIPDDATRARDIIKRQGFEPGGASRIRNTASVEVRETAFIRDLADFF